MILATILSIIVVVVIIYLLFQLFNSNKGNLSDKMPGNQEKIIKPSSLSSYSNSNNYTYSIWFYIDNWNYRYGEPKIILGSLDSNKNPSPSITLAPMQNDINISLTCYPKDKSKKHIIHTCTLENVPLQTWSNLVVSLDGRSLDVYLNGKLVKTCVLPGVAKISTNAKIHITPGGGFSGYTSHLEYKSKSSNPSEVWQIYKKNASIANGGLANAASKYKVKVALMDNNKEEKSFQF